METVKKRKHRIGLKRLTAAVLTAVMMVALSFQAAADETGRDKIDDVTVYFKNLLGEARLVCDLENNPAYQNFSIRKICSDLERSYDTTVLNYRNRYITVLGKVIKTSANGSKVTLTDVEGTGGEIIAKSSDAEIKQIIRNLKEGDIVRVYGKAQVGTKLDKTVTIKADRIESSLQTANKADTVYSFVSGAGFDTAEGKQRSLYGKMNYVIPASWEGVEEEISGTGMKGYLYRVNEIPATYSTGAEQVYVFYFDYETGLKYLSDRNERVKEIERAIVSNILIYDTAADFPDRNITTEDGQKFSYYDTSYHGGDNRLYNVEFIFSPGDDGIACVMYVFSSSDHKEDIIFMLNTMTVK